MGRKKRRFGELKPFCYYCDREFEDQKILIQHQKSKHFRCPQCTRRLDTAAGLVVHMLQVHKEGMSIVPNSLSGRDQPDIIIHGMDGVPELAIADKKVQMLQRVEQERRHKQQRVNWTQVTMAPPDIDTFLRMAQNGELPDFEGITQLQHLSNFSAFMTAVTGSAPQLKSLSSSTPVASPSPIITHTMKPTGTSTGFSPSLMANFERPDSLEIANGMTVDQKTEKRPQPYKAPQTVPAQLVTPGPTPVPMVVPLPPNVKLMYEDDAVSIEEARAHTVGWSSLSGI